MSRVERPAYIGVNPKVERYLWSDFQVNLMVTLQAVLLPSLLPKYTADIEERRYGHEREPYLTIRLRQNRQLVTIIELLSPSNKRPNSDGRREYLTKREQILQSPVHLVEIDLLLQGERLPTVEPLPEADFYVFVSRGNRRPAVEVYRWKLKQPLPTIRIPLLPEDPDLLLNLEDAYEQTFARARYDMRLDYTQE